MAADLSAAERFRERLARATPLILDGATGTELERRGARTGLPLWSAHALVECPDLVQQVHADYVSAGAELLTANTFRTQRRTLDRGGIGEYAGELAARAVELARRAARHVAPERGVFVAGSAPPLEDCYRPDLVPDAAALESEHAEHARHLVAAGVDLILVETMNSVREAVAATRAARAAGAAVAVSFACGSDGKLLSREPLETALRAVTPCQPVALLVNCLPPSAIPACLPALRDAGIPFGAYANLGAPLDPNGARRTEFRTPEQFAALAAEWIAAGARLVGGCCGTTPAHIHALSHALRR